jgi:pyrophosphatase PpaX
VTSARWESVIFDLDGTLADTIDLIVASYNHAYVTVTGRPRAESELRALIGRPLLETFAARDPEVADELQRAYTDWNLANTERLIKRYAGVPELLEELSSAGVRLGVVTSKRRGTARLALRGVGIEDSVRLLAGLEDTDRHKPDPEPLLLGARSLGTPPEDCVYVGDAVVDVRAARAARMAAVAVTWGAGDEDGLVAAGPDAVATSVAELGEILLPGRGTADP